MPNIQVLTGQAAHTLVMRMQVDAKPFDDIRVRKAVQLASDNKQMLDIAYRGERGSGRQLPRLARPARLLPLDPIARDVEKAKALAGRGGV